MSKASSKLKISAGHEPRITKLTFELCEVQLGFADGEIGVERSDLLSENQQVFDQKELTVQHRLQINTTNMQR